MQHTWMDRWCMDAGWVSGPRLCAWVVTGWLHAERVHAERLGGCTCCVGERVRRGRRAGRAVPQ